jgi:hypothetical protein
MTESLGRMDESTAHALALTVTFAARRKTPSRLCWRFDQR